MKGTYSVIRNVFGNVVKISDADNSSTVYKTFAYNTLLGAIVSSMDYNSQSTSDDDVTVSNTFDTSTGNLISQTRQIGTGSQREVDYSYNSVTGRLNTITYPSLREVGYTYNNRNLIEKITLDTADAACYTYDFMQRIDTKQIKDSGLEMVTLDIDYNEFSEITDYTWSQGGTPLLDYEYGYDFAGNRLYKYKGHNDDESDLYSYDSAHRLVDFQRGTLVEPDRDEISGTPVMQENWDLDELYNWNSWTKDSQTENRTHNLANELTARDSQNLTYDGKGNLTDDGTYEYEWDKFNRLIKVSSDSTLLAEYIYDAGNRRIAKTVYDGGSSETTEYVLSANWQVLEEYVNGTLEKTYVYGLYIDEPVLMENSLGDKYFYCHDAQYSVTAMLDDIGDIVERYEYTPYGKTDVFTDPGTDATWFTDDDEYTAANEIGNPYRFTGRRFDSESGLYYFRNRMWSGEMGRFITRDPVGYVDGMSLYAGKFIIKKIDWQGTKSVGCCGPDLTKAFHDYIIINLPFLSRLSPSVTGPADKYRAMLAVGGGIDFLLNNPPEGCATEECKNSVMFCGECVRAVVLSNILFGIVANALGIEERYAALGALIKDRGHDEGPEQWGAYSIGYDLWRWNQKSFDLSSKAMCRIMRTATTDLGINPKNPMYYSRPFSPLSFWLIREAFKDCRPCGKEMTLDQVLEGPGNNIGMGFWLSNNRGLFFKNPDWTKPALEPELEHILKFSKLYEAFAKKR